MYLFILLIISVVIHKIWFFSQAILTSGDWGFHFHENLLGFLQLPSIWTTAGNGSIDFGLSSYPIIVLWGFFGSLCSFSCAERILYMYPAIIVAITSSYYLSRYITKSNLAAAVGAICFTYNTYFVIGRTGHLTLMMAFAFAPFIFLLLIKLHEKITRTNLILLFFINTIVSFYEFRAWYIIALLEFLFIGFYAFIHSKSKNSKNIILTTILSLSAVVSVVIVNLYWMLAFYAGSSLVTNKYFTRGLFGDSFMNISNAITLFHPFWTGARSSIFVVQPLPLYFWLIPLCAFVGLYFNRHNKHVVFFGFVSIIGILLTKQSGIPFTFLYKFLYYHFPGFNAFREASKFYFFIAFGYSVLTASFIGYVFNNKNSSILYKLRYAVLFLVLFLFTVNTKPIITGEIGTLFKERFIPQDYISYQNLVSSNTSFYRSLWIPRDSRWSYHSEIHPSLSIGEILPFEFMSKKQGGILDYINTDSFLSYLIYSSTKYITIPLQDIRNDDDFYIDYDKRDEYIKVLDSKRFLHRESASTGDIIVYSFDSYKDHIYTDASNVSHTYIKPFKYKIKLSKLSRMQTIYFTDTFHKGWTLFVRKENLFNTLNKKGGIASKEYKITEAFSINSFNIDANFVKKTIPKDQYIQNDDGSVNIEATMYFVPQIYIYLGAVITFVFFSLLISLYLMYRKVLKNIL